MATKGNKRDRDKLKKRVKAALGDAGMTQKDFEDAHELSTGTLTRLFGGRRSLDRELLDALASGLSLDAAELVSGTGFTEVLEGDAAEATPAPSKPAASKPKPAASKPTPAASKPKPAASEPKAASPAPAASKSTPAASKPKPAASTPAPAAKPAEAKAAPEPVREPTAEKPKPAPSKASGPSATEPPPSGGSEKKRFLPFRILKSIKDLVFGD
jgi:transcriptional regulator with XRE-family HTH domain